MNREHKYRGKRKDNGQWVYGYYLKFDGTDFIVDDLLFVHNPVDPATVGEFTGRRDSKRTKEYPEGQEIYEGDILQGLHGRYPIEWNSKHACFEARIAGFATRRAETWEEIEVIGNIHAAPEAQK